MSAQGPARARLWLLGLVPLALIAAAIAVFSALDAPGVPKRAGPPVEELSVERTVLRPGRIELTVRNDGPGPAQVAQVTINDAFVPFTATAGALPRLGARRLTIPYPWVEGEAYAITLLTSRGTTIPAEVPIAVATPRTGLGFYGVMAALGVYVGVVPVLLGMLWLPWVRRVGARWIRVLMAVTVGLLAFLAIDATIDGVGLAGQGPQAFGGPALVFLGAAVAYLTLSAVDAWVRSRREAAEREGTSGDRLALLIAVGVGLHNLGEGLAIGSAYALGSLALGAFLVIGFVLQNTSEGLAIVVPFADAAPSRARLAGLGLIAGAPAVVGAWIGASAFNTSVAAFLLGMGVGAVVQVVQQIVPTIRDRTGRALNPASAAGVATGMGILYATGLLVTA